MHPQANHRTGSNEQWKLLFVCLVLALAVWIVFGQTIHHGFINYDDNAYVYDNPQVKAGLTRSGFLWALTYAKIGHWHPLTWLSHMLDCQLYGSWAGGHHLTNVLLHGAAAISLFLVLRSMTGELWRSAFVSVVFAIHPLRAESVAWIAERKDVLSALFFMLTLGAYVRWVRGKRSPAGYIGLLLLFACGLLAKGMLVTLPFVLLLLDYWPLGRLDLAAKKSCLMRLVMEKVPLFALSFLSCLATSLSPEKFPASEAMPLATRLGHAVVFYGNYLWRTFFPARLAIPYPNPASGQPLSGIALSLSALVLLSAAAILLRKKQPYFIVGWLWYLGMLVPVIGIVQQQASDYVETNRYTYLPQIGILLAIVWGISGLLPKRAHLALGIGACCPVIVLGYLAHAETSFWRDSQTLFTHSLSNTTGNSIAHNNLATVLIDKGLDKEAIADCREALKANPGNLEARLNLALALSKTAQFDEAAHLYREVVDQQPKNLSARFNLGKVMLQKGEWDEAILHLRAGLQISPADAQALYDLGMALMQKGQMREAVNEWQKAYEIAPSNSSAPNEIAWVLATCPDSTFRDGAKAVAMAEKAMQISGGKDAGILDTLAASYAEAGRFAEALATARHALELAESQGNGSLSDSLKMEIELYKAGKPFHESRQIPNK